MPSKPVPSTEKPSARLVVVTGLSGSGKGTVLKALEDLGFYSVDNLPIELLAKFAELTNDTQFIRHAALGIDIREGTALQKLPALYKKLRRDRDLSLLFLEADDEVLLRRFSETRRPHPLGTASSVLESVRMERQRMEPIRALADVILNTSKFTVHELRAVVNSKFATSAGGANPISVYVTSFGYRNGVPTDSDLVFDVRFLPNPNYIPEFKHLTGKSPQVARYIRSFRKRRNSSKRFRNC